MHTPNLTPPRPVSHELRAVGTRASALRAPPAPSGSRGVRTAVLLLLALGLAATFLAAPYRAASHLGDALVSGDPAELEEVIDFAALREDLKRQTAAAIDPAEGGGKAGLAIAGAALANATIDAVVQPEMVAKLKTLPVDAATKARLERAVERARVGYEGINTFSIRLVVLDVSDEPIKIRLGRSGAFSWKVEGVTLPTDLSKLADFGGDTTGEPIRLEGVARVD